MQILALDTATESCSVALLSGEGLITREEEPGRGHAQIILPMIDAVLAEAGRRLTDLTAIAFGRGPGGFTGVRLAASVTQGLAFGAGLPVVPVSDLAALAQRALDADPSAMRVLVVNDARMREVYWGCFTRQEGLACHEGAEHVGAPGTVSLPPAWAGQAVTGVGRGLALHLGTGPRSALAQIQDRWLPRAREIAWLARAAVARGEVVAPEEAIPVYLRDQVAHVRT
jgi:tRNA threonylcarbamoyladenosine biosynthesis protein TsaB